ncbi:hypothetical protein BG006_011483, partial [Podila minutissima]
EGKGTGRAKGNGNGKGKGKAEDDDKAMTDSSSQPQKVEPSATGKVPKLKIVNLSVLGAICWTGVINMVLRIQPVDITPYKERKVTGKNKTKHGHDHE